MFRHLGLGGGALVAVFLVACGSDEKQDGNLDPTPTPFAVASPTPSGCSETIEGTTADIRVTVKNIPDYLSTSFVRLLIADGMDVQELARVTGDAVAEQSVSFQGTGYRDREYAFPVVYGRQIVDIASIPKGVSSACRLEATYDWSTGETQ